MSGLIIERRMENDTETLKHELKSALFSSWLEG